MESLELVVWWLVTGAGVFALLFVASRLWGARSPRLFQVLWLVFFVKLVVPVGVWSPLPSAPRLTSEAPTSTVGLTTADESRIAVTGTWSPSPGFQPAAAARTLVLDPTGWAMALWLGGALASGWWSVRAYRRSLRSSALGPAVVGVFRPRLVLPADFEQRFSPEEQELVLAHEREHLRAGDPFWLALVQALVCLLWWVPFVWWARAEFRAVTELACDQAVLDQRSAPEARAYGQLMLRQAIQPRGEAGIAFAASFGGLKRRLTAVVNPRRWRGLWLGLLVLTLAGGLAAASLVPQASDWAWPLPDGPEDRQGLVPPSSGDLGVFGGIAVGVLPGTPVKAAAEGYIVELVDDERNGSTVTLEHGNGYRTKYGRIDRDPDLALAMKVKAGQLLGIVHGLKAGFSVTDTILPALWLGVWKDGQPVDPATVFPQAARLAAPVFLKQALAWPLPAGLGTPTTRFGVDVHPFTGQPFFHKGVDWAVPTGTEVFAVADGTVAKVDYDALGLGWYVEIDHGDGRMSRYGHLMAAASGLERGQRIAARQGIGKAGASGLATGPHLHWELLAEHRSLDPLRVAYGVH